MSEFNANLQKALAYLQEAQIKISTSQDYNGRGQVALQEVVFLQQEYINKIMSFAGVVQQAQS